MATLFDSASLALIPSGVKDGKAYSIKPTDGSGDFTFSRGTGTATRVNASGLIEKERSNQLLQSNTFDTTWLPNGPLTITSGQTGYDGSSDAWKIEKDANAFRYVYQDISFSGVQTISVYAKANTLNIVTLYVSAASNAYAKFSLVDGSVLSSSNIIDSSADDVSNGWWRLSIQVNDSITRVRIYPDFDETSAGSIYIQDAQLEQGLVATDYIETTTAAVYEGITDNLPRLDYSGGASCPSLLLESSRTNQVDYSEYLNGHSISLGTNGGAMTITDNYTDSPEGVQNAGRIQASIVDTTDTSEFALLTLNGNTLLSGDNVISFYAKSMTGVDQDVLVYWNYSKEIITITNEWQRFSINANASNNSSVFIGTRGGNPNDYFAGGDANLDFALWGLQVEQGATYPTSYIPTYGTAASRAADGLNKTGISDLIGQTEGVLFLDYIYDHNQVNAELFSISDGSVANRIYVGEIGGGFVVLVRKDSVTQFNQSGLTPVVGQRYKLAVAYAENDFAFYVNGTQIATSSSGSVPATSQVRNDSGAGSSNLYHNINQVLLFKTRLTNAELAALTTL
jgi:hypothetical protein